MSFRVFPAGNPSSSMPVFFCFFFSLYSPLPNVRKRMWHVGCGKWSSKGRRSLLLGSIRIVLSCWACTELGIVVCCMLYVQQSDCQLGCGLSTRSSALPLYGMALSLVDEVEVKARAMNGTGCQWALKIFLIESILKALKKWVSIHGRIWKITGDIGKPIELEIKKS